MTEQEELIMLRALVEKQKKEIEEKDETIRRQNIQIEGMLQALLHAKSRDLDVRRKPPSFRDN